MRGYDEIEAELIAPGGLFEVVEEEVLGQSVRVFKNRARSLRELLAASAGHAGKDYLVLGSRRVSYEQHLRLVASTARAMAERYGIAPGDRVAIVAENHVEWVIAFWATVSLGGIVAALNGWWTGDEIRYGLELSEPKLLIGDRKRLARIDGGDAGVATVEIEGGFDELLGYAPDAELPEQPIAEDDPALILFTSGTTGRPKGAVHSHRGVCGFAHVAFLHGYRQTLLAAEEGRGDAAPPAPCSLVTSPLFHMSGLHNGAVIMLAAGGTVVLRLGRFDPEEVLQLIERERVTIWSGLGAMAPRVLYHPKLGAYDTSTLRSLGSGGAPTSPELQERMREVAPNGADGVGVGYGSSETVTPVVMLGGKRLRATPTSVGPVQPTHEVEVRDAAGNPKPEGVEGEIFVRSAYTMLEYWRDPDATAATLGDGRWLATGDIGRFEDGWLYINSRARDLILRAAENVYPAEIEQRLEAHDDVAEAAVVGVDHAELGQEVKAIVVAADGANVDTDALQSWCAQTLAAFKVPSLWELREDPLPRNATGKVLKHVLTGEAESLFVEE